jgi:predicted nucleic acid-binding Zn ribbon protein
MRRSKTISLAEAIQDYIKEMNIGPKLKEISLLDSWETMVGKAISSRTSKVYIKDKVLFVHLNSSVVRNELMMIREALKEKLNSQAGEEVIKDIVLK